MRRRWMLAAAGLLLAACRTNGERGEAAQDRAPGMQGGRPAQADRSAAGVTPEESATARLLAATRAVAQAEVDAGKLAQQRASSADVKDYATRSVAEHQATLDALSDLVKAKKLDLDTASVQNDPLLKAQKDTAREAVDRMRTLSGTAFDAAYMTAQRPAQAFLRDLAQQAPVFSKDADIGNAFRAIAQQARDRMNKVVTILPRACGGERPGWGGAG
jgi:predicted outer membrane protein